MNKLKLIAGAVPCSPNWVKSTPGNIPENFFVAARSSKGKLLGVCRGPTPNNSTTVGMLKDSSCYISWGFNVTNATTFDVLTGTGFQWVTNTKKVRTFPKKSYPAGYDWDQAEYVGRCNIKDDTFVGKIINTFDNFYYGYNGKELQDCKHPDILLCDQDPSDF